MGCKVVSVAVDNNVFKTDKPYHYFLPEHLTEIAKVGMRVTVPFGKGNVKKTGLILGFEEAPLGTKCKFVDSLLDEKPVLTEKMLKLAAFIREQTFCTYYNAIRVLLPPGINFKIKNSYSLSESADTLYDSLSDELKEIVRLFKETGKDLTKEVVISSLGLSSDNTLVEKLVSKGILIKNSDAVRSVLDASQKIVKLTDLANDLSLFKLTDKQKRVIATLGEMECCSLKELCYFTGLTSAVVNGLQKKGLVTVFEQEYYRNPYSNVFAKNYQPKKLTDEQQQAFETLYSAYTVDAPKTALLYGVTGSGKTQVFLKLCEEVVKKGRGVIVMVPEIALTPQTLNIFHQRFGSSVAVFHSAMSQGQRLDEWKRVKNGDAKIAVGTRSAVFAPFEDVGLIIIDEEQEHTYKSEMSPHFHARDIARFRVAQSKGLVVLSSATPSIETYSAALSGKYLLCSLSKRYGNAKLPVCETVDMRKEFAAGNKSIISNLLYDRLDDALKSGHQAILLLNRRGFNTYISCPSCGEVLTCDNCSISMTYHSANNRIMCHYCGKSKNYSDKCSNCGCEQIKYTGIGTQKAEEELKELFPEAKILRMDADSIMTRTDYETYLKKFSDGEYDIMLGTQMVAKGLDFPKVTVVGVLNADTSLHSSDYRSFERTFSLLAQVVGRSGRGDDEGTAVIQTNNPDSPIISLAANQDYDAFYKSEILTRKLMVYPPYCDIATVSFQGVDRNWTEKAAGEFLSIIKNKASGQYKDSVKIIVLGPTVAAVPKVNNKYRYKLIIKYKNSEHFRKMINEVFDAYSLTEYFKKVSAFIDVNPDSII